MWGGRFLLSIRDVYKIFYKFKKKGGGERERKKERKGKEKGKKIVNVVT